MVGPEGGTLELENGVVIEVPPGALSEEVRFEVTLLDPDETQALLDESGNHPRHYVGGVDVQPSGTALAMPITVTFPIQRTATVRGLPIHFAYDADYHAWYPSETPTDVETDPDAGTVTLVLDTLSPHVTAEVEEVIERLCAAEPCKCGRVSVKESARNYEFYDAGGEDCRAAEIRGSATYHECNEGAGLTETWLFIEHSDGCVPRLTLTPESESMMVGESKPFEARATYVGRPYAATELTARSSLPTVATVSTDALLTNPEGVASFDVRGVSDGASTVVVEGTVRYRPREITINGMVQEREERTKRVVDRSSVAVGGVPRLTVEIQPGAEGDFLRPGEATTVHAEVRDTNGDLLPDVQIRLSASAGSLGDTTVRTGRGPGVSGYTAPSEDGIVTIEARAEVTVLNALAEEVTHSLVASDTITVQSGDTETWTGSAILDFVIPGGFDDELRGTASVDFTLTYDPTAAPREAVMGSATAQINLDPRDSSPRTRGDCTITEFWSDVSDGPFDVRVEAGLLLDGLSLRFPLVALEPIAGARLNRRETCSGMTEEFLLDTYEVSWGPSIASFGDAHYDTALFALGSVGVDTVASDSVTITGDCSLGSEVGTATCGYTLTVTRP